MQNVEYKFTLTLNPTTEEEKDNNKTIIEKVAMADDIIVFIHGIIGDTESILKCIKTPLDEKGDTLVKSDMNTLVVSFDYENLNTSIKQTAADLRDRFVKVGLTKGHNKNLIIVAHSMGGLVSRWFIEKLGGHEVVNKLVMLGTPNNGSNWTDVRDMADALLTYALNGAATIKPWMLILTKIGGRIFKDVQITLIEMGPDSEFAKDLNNKIAPEIHYVVIAGNTQKIIVNYEGTSSFIDNWFRRVKNKGLYDALDVLLFKKPNDIAVTDESIRTLKTTTAGWKVKPIEHEVACDHLNYFLNIDSLRLIKQALI